MRVTAVERHLLPKKLQRHAAAAIVSLFTVVYFIDIYLRASGKYFWYDELYTVYVCRLPDLHAVWQAVLHGADYNPPLFHVLTRLANAPFGEGLVATRAPAAIAFWLLCISLFAMVRKRSGIAAGVVAMLFPMLSLAEFYAYEARPHGIVMGMAGLAALAWQRRRETHHRTIWLTLFAASLLSALLVHCYAITLLFPFGAAELYRVWRTRRLDWPLLVTMALDAAIAVAVYIPMLRAYHTYLGTGFFTPGATSFQKFYESLLTPAILALVACFVVFALARAHGRARGCELPEGVGVVPDSELALAFGFLALPLVGLAISVAMNSSFIDRYFASAIIGVSLIAGFGVGFLGRSKWLPVALAGILSLLVAFNSARVVWHRLRGIDEALVEPSTQEPYGTTRGSPMAGHPLLLANTPGDLPIVVLDSLEFFFLENYAPPAVRERLYYIRQSPAEFNGRALSCVKDSCRLPFQLAYAGEFLPSHPKYYLYGNLTVRVYNNVLQQLLRNDASVQLVSMDSSHFVAEVDRPSSK